MKKLCVVRIWTSSEYGHRPKHCLPAKSDPRANKDGGTGLDRKEAEPTFPGRKKVFLPVLRVRDRMIVQAGKDLLQSAIILLLQSTPEVREARRLVDFGLLAWLRGRLLPPRDPRLVTAALDAQLMGRRKLQHFGKAVSVKEPLIPTAVLDD